MRAVWKYEHKKTTHKRRRPTLAALGSRLIAGPSSYIDRGAEKTKLSRAPGWCREKTISESKARQRLNIIIIFVMIIMTIMVIIINCVLHGAAES